MQFTPTIKENQSLFHLSNCADLQESVRIEHLVKIEDGVYALFDAKGKLSFVTPDEEGSISVLPLKNKIEAQQEIGNNVQVLEHSERQELLRDMNYQVLKYELEAIHDFVEGNPFLQDQSVFDREKVIAVGVLRVKEGILMHVLSQMGFLYSFLLIIQQSASSDKVSLVINTVAETKVQDL